MIQKPREGAPVARLNVDSGFSWDSSHAPDAKKSKKTVLRNEEESSSEESDVEEEETVVKEVRIQEIGSICGVMFIQSYI